MLNRSYHPVRITTVREAFSLLFCGRADALDAAYEPHCFERWAGLRVEAHEPSVRTPRGALRAPRLLLLRGYNRVPRTPLRLSRRNVFLRDGHACMYCGDDEDELTIDHVLPRSRGGRSSWENLVACCRRCNLDKGHRTPEEAGMTLRVRPARPTWTVVVQLDGLKHPLPDWEPFLEGVLPRAS
ncbi:MAG: HNH endonuclease [Myxococcales bacterium]|nr:HNH endonuclease [Myxococcales bacterium]